MRTRYLLSVCLVVTLFACARLMGAMEILWGYGYSGGLLSLWLLLPLLLQSLSLLSTWLLLLPYGHRYRGRPRPVGHEGREGGGGGLKAAVSTVGAAVGTAGAAVGTAGGGGGHGGLH